MVGKTGDVSNFLRGRFGKAVQWLSKLRFNASGDGCPGAGASLAARTLKIIRIREVER